MMIKQQDVTLSKVSQITINTHARQTLGVDPGDKINMVFNDDGTITLKKAETDEEKIKRIFRELGKMRREWLKKATPEQRKFAEMSRGWTIDQYHEYFDNLPETKVYIKEKYGVDYD